MKSRHNFIAAFAIFGLIAVGVIIDKWYKSIRLHAGQTFNFQVSVVAYLAFTFLIGLLILLFVYLLLIRLKPDQWVFILCLACSLFIVLPLVFTFIIRFDAFLDLLPSVFRMELIQVLIPVSYTSFVVATLFWTALIGLFRKPFKS